MPDPTMLVVVVVVVEIAVLERYSHRSLFQHCTIRYPHFCLSLGISTQNGNSCLFLERFNGLYICRMCMDLLVHTELWIYTLPYLWSTLMCPTPVLYDIV